MSTKSSKAPKKLNKKAYEKELERLQAELVDMQQWVVETGARVVITVIEYSDVPLRVEE